MIMMINLKYECKWMKLIRLANHTHIHKICISYAKKNGKKIVDSPISKWWFLFVTGNITYMMKSKTASFDVCVACEKKFFVEFKSISQKWIKWYTYVMWLCCVCCSEYIRYCDSFFYLNLIKYQSIVCSMQMYYFSKFSTIQ